MVRPRTIRALRRERAHRTDASERTVDDSPKRSLAQLEDARLPRRNGWDEPAQRWTPSPKTLRQHPVVLSDPTGDDDAREVGPKISPAPIPAPLYHLVC